MWPSFSGQPFSGQFFTTLTLLRLLSCHFQPKVLSFVWEGETTQSSFASFTLAHAVASTVELFNSTGSLTHIMIFFSSSIIIFHFASLEYPLLECTPLICSPVFSYPWFIPPTLLSSNISPLPELDQCRLPSLAQALRGLRERGVSNPQPTVGSSSNTRHLRGPTRKCSAVGPQACLST